MLAMILSSDLPISFMIASCQTNINTHPQANRPGRVRYKLHRSPMLCPSPCPISSKPAAHHHLRFSDCIVVVGCAAFPAVLSSCCRRLPFHSVRQHLTRLGHCILSMPLRRRRHEAPTHRHPRAAGRAATTRRQQPRTEPSSSLEIARRGDTCPTDGAVDGIYEIDIDGTELKTVFVSVKASKCGQGRRRDGACSQSLARIVILHATPTMFCFFDLRLGPRRLTLVI